MLEVVLICATIVWSLNIAIGLGLCITYVLLSPKRHPILPGTRWVIAGLGQVEVNSVDECALNRVGYLIPETETKFQRVEYCDIRDWYKIAIPVIDKTTQEELEYREYKRMIKEFK